MTRTRNLSIREANLRTIRDIEARIPAARTSAIDECIEVVKARFGPESYTRISLVGDFEDLKRASPKDKTP